MADPLNPGGGNVPAQLMRVLDIHIRKKHPCVAFREKVVATAPPTFGGVYLLDLNKYHLAFPLALLYCGGFMGLLVYLTYSGTVTLVGQKYLSLENSDSNSVCTTLPQAVTGLFEGTWDGTWITNSSFQYSKSIFKLEFTESHIDNEAYTKVMNSFAQQMNVYGQKGISRASLWSELIYASYSFRDTASHMHFFSSADASDMFDTQIYTSTISSQYGTCKTSNSTGGKFIFARLDEATSCIVVSVPILPPVDYINARFPVGGPLEQALVDPCPHQIPLIKNAFLYNPSTAANEEFFINFKFDISTIITVLTLNLGLSRASGLERIEAKINIKTAAQNGRNPIPNFDKINAYIDPFSFSPDRTPVYCYDKVALGLTQAQIDGPDMCFLGSHNDGQNTVQFFYPTVIQMANNPKKTDVFGNLKMDECKCPRDAQNAFCNYQDIIWGMIYDFGSRSVTSVVIALCF